MSPELGKFDFTLLIPFHLLRVDSIIAAFDGKTRRTVEREHLRQIWANFFIAATVTVNIC